MRFWSAGGNADAGVGHRQPHLIVAGLSNWRDGKLAKRRTAPPSGVNFTALPAQVLQHVDRLSKSPRTSGTSGATSLVSVNAPWPPAAPPSRTDTHHIPVPPPRLSFAAGIKTAHLQNVVDHQHERLGIGRRVPAKARAAFSSPPAPCLPSKSAKATMESEQGAQRGSPWEEVALVSVSSTGGHLPPPTGDAAARAPHWPAAGCAVRPATSSSSKFA